LRRFASGECVGVTRSNYSPVATLLIDYMKLRNFGYSVCLLCKG